MCYSFSETVQLEHISLKGTWDFFHRVKRLYNMQSQLQPRKILLMPQKVLFLVSYRSSNFTTAKVVALDFLAFFLYRFCTLMGTFLYCFLLSYRSSNYYNSNINCCRSFSLLQHQKEYKEEKQKTDDTKNKAKKIKSDNFTRSFIEKRTILQHYNNFGFLEHK